MKSFIKIFFLILSLQAYNQETKSEKMIVGVEYPIKSKILGEERSYIISLPKSYDISNNSYPVMVLTDGDYRFIQASGLIEFMSKESRIPETILIAIPNFDRNKDLTPTTTSFNTSSGGGENFLNFIENELLTEIDRIYRTNGYRILAGHSLGGLFTGFAYTSDSSFDGYIATDPSFWWDNQIINEKINSELAQRLKNKRIYISCADNYERNEGMVTFMRNAQELFYNQFKSQGVDKKNIEIQYFENENHGTSAYMSLYHGLQFVFKGFVLENIYSKSPDEIKKHYIELSSQSKSDFHPPEHIIRNMGEHQLAESNNELAINLFALNVEYFPSAANHEKLGDAFVVIKNKKDAAKHYKHALSFNPKNTKELNTKINKL